MTKPPSLDEASAPFHTWTLPDGTVWAELIRVEGDYLINFPRSACFRISGDGLDIRYWPLPGATRSEIEHLYLNQVLPLALSRRGQLVFHASAVVIDGGAIAFIARSGLGKSTLAAAFSVNGFPFLTDDGLFIADSKNGPIVDPGHPSIRLYLDSQEAIGTPKDRELSREGYCEKARVVADDVLSFCKHPRPLHRCYFLGENLSHKVDIKPLSAREALIELVRHSFLLDVKQRDLLKFQFEGLSMLANRSLHYRLNFPRHYDFLTSVQKAILDHARSTDNENITA